MVERPFAVLAAVAMAPVVVVISLSDRAPLAGLRVIDKVEAAGARFGVDLASVDPPVAPDLLVHVALWAVVGFVAHRLAAGRIPPVVTASALVMASYPLELGQAFVTSTRSIEGDDLVANVIGVLVGMALASVWTRSVALLRRG